MKPLSQSRWHAFLFIALFCGWLTTKVQADAIPSITIRSFAGGGAGVTPALQTSIVPVYLVVHPDNSTVLLSDGRHWVLKLNATTNNQSFQACVYAGVGFAGFGGDGKSATLACLNTPTGMAVDASGHLFIADAGNNRIRLVSPNGIITTFAGGGIGGDGGPATAASLNGPRGVALQGGTLYIADTNDNSVRAVYQNGTIMTAFSSSTAAIMVLDVAIENPSTIVFVDGRAPYRQLGKISNGVATYLDVNFSHAGDGAVTLSKTSSSWLVAARCHVASFSTSQPGKQVLAGTDGTCGGGRDKLQNASSAVYHGGDVWMADQGNQRVQVLPAAGSNAPMYTVAGTGTAGFEGNMKAVNAILTSPTALTAFANSATLLVDGNRVLLISATGNISVFAGNTSTSALSGDGAPATLSSLSQPSGIAYAPELEAVFISEAGRHRIRWVNLSNSNNVITTCIGTGTAGPTCSSCDIASATVRGPTSLAYDGTYKRLFLADAGNKAIRVANFDPTGDHQIYLVAASGTSGQLDDWPASSAGLGGTIALAYVDETTLMYADTEHHCIRKITIAAPFSSSTVRTVAGVCGQMGSADNTTSPSFSSPSALTMGPDANTWYVSDQGSQGIRRIDLSKSSVSTFAGSGAWTPTSTLSGPSLMSFIGMPQGLMYTPGRLLVADSFTARVWEVVVPPPPSSTPSPTRASYTATMTASLSPSFVMTVTGSFSPTVTESNTQSVSQSDTSSVTPTPTQINSISATGSGSSSATSTLGTTTTASGTPAPTMSLDLSPSASRTECPTQSSSATASISATRAIGVTSSGSPSTASTSPDSTGHTHTGALCNTTDCISNVVASEAAFADQPAGAAVVAVCVLSSATACLLFPCCIAYRRHVKGIRERNQTKRKHYSTTKAAPLPPVPPAVHRSTSDFLKQVKSGDGDSLTYSVEQCRSSMKNKSRASQQAGLHNLYANPPAMTDARTRELCHQLLFASGYERKPASHPAASESSTEEADPASPLAETALLHAGSVGSTDVGFVSVISDGKHYAPANTKHAIRGAGAKHGPGGNVIRTGTNANKHAANPAFLPAGAHKRQGGDEAFTPAAKAEGLLVDAIVASLHVASVVTVEGGDDDNLGAAFELTLEQVLEHTVTALVTSASNSGASIQVAQQRVIRAAGTCFADKITTRAAPAKAVALLGQVDRWPRGSEALQAAFATRLTDLQSVAAQQAREVTASGQLEVEPSFTQFVVVHVLARFLKNRRNKLHSAPQTPDAESFTSPAETDPSNVGISFANPLSAKPAHVTVSSPPVRATMSFRVDDDGDVHMPTAVATSGKQASLVLPNKLAALRTKFSSRRMMPVSGRALITPTRIRSAK